MGKVPGGSYFVAMLRNNPDAQEAIRSIDPSRPETMQVGMRRLLAVFGMSGPQADAMIGQAMQTMQDPAAMKRMAEQAGLGDVAGTIPGFGGAGVAPTVSDPAPAASVAAPDGPPFKGLAQAASKLIADGSERVAFDQMTAALDDPSTVDYDPRDRRFADLTELLEVYATEIVAAGRQIAPRFGSLYQRAAMHVGLDDPTPPAVNPAFSSWCLRVARAIARG